MAAVVARRGGDKRKRPAGQDGDGDGDDEGAGPAPRAKRTRGGRRPGGAEVEETGAEPVDLGAAYD